MDDTTHLPASVGGRGRLSTVEQLADIPEEQIWLQKQKSPRTRRAYWLDVQHFRRRRIVVAAACSLSRMMRSQAITALRSAWRRSADVVIDKVRLAAPSSLYKHLVRHGHATRNPVGEVERPAINRDEGSTLAFSKAQARKVLVHRWKTRFAGLRHRAIRSVGLRVGLRRAEIAALKVGDLHQNRGYDSLRVARKGGRRDALAINPQTAALHTPYLEPAVHGADVNGPLFRPLTSQRQATGAAPAHGPRRDRSGGAKMCYRARLRSRVLGALDARDLHDHGARKRRSA